MTKIGLFIIILFISCGAPRVTGPSKIPPPPPEITTQLGAGESLVEAKGVGVDRTSALNDAKRQAIAQGIGVKVKSETAVKDFVLQKDIITTQMEGFAKILSVVSETQYPDRYEVVVKAAVSLLPLESDMKILVTSIGDMMILVFYDEREAKTEDQKRLYEYTYDRINEYLSLNRYDYVEKDVFFARRDEIIKRNPNISGDSLAKELTRRAGANYYIKFRLNIASGSVGDAVSVEMKAYENETGFGLGVKESEPMVGGGSEVALERLKNAIAPSVAQGMPLLMSQVNSKISDWALNGVKYHATIYNLPIQGGDEYWDALVVKLKADFRFGGKLTDHLNMDDRLGDMYFTFKGTPDECRRMLRDHAKSIPAFVNIKVRSSTYGRIELTL